MRIVETVKAHRELTFIGAFALLAIPFHMYDGRPTYTHPSYSEPAPPPTSPKKETPVRPDNTVLFVGPLPQYRKS